MVATFRVYKKTSPNGKMTVYLSKRDFVDHIKYVDPIDGVVLISDEYLEGRKVLGMVLATFRYGREEDEVMGLHFSKELCLASGQVCPRPEGQFDSTTKMQQRLLKKLGPNAFPFHFQIPTNAPQSVTIQPGPQDEGEPCGVYYDLKIYVASTLEEKGHRRSTVRFGFRKIQWAKVTSTRQPCSVIRKDFLMSPGDMELEATLDQQVYQPGEEIEVSITVRNYSNKTVKGIRASVIQNIDICMFASGHYHVTLDKTITREGCPIISGSTVQKVVTLMPATDYKQRYRGLALDGKLKNEDTSLAASTILPEEDGKDLFGIVISYAVKVKLLLGALGGEVVAELPFILMRPQPKKLPVQMDSIDRELEIEQFKSSRENTLDFDDGDKPIAEQDAASLKFCVGTAH